MADPFCPSLGRKDRRMVAIRRIARWILLLASLAFVIPFPSDAKESVESGSILIAILMVLLALDMLLLILRVPRKRVQVLLEFGLYPAFIELLLFRLITSNAVSSLMSHEVSTLGACAPLLLLFAAIYGLLVASAFIVLLDAKNSYQGKNASHPD